ncbi:unnamed protein product, partial [Mesorhabditis spiculigera]
MLVVLGLAFLTLSAYRAVLVMPIGPYANTLQNDEIDNCTLDCLNSTDFCVGFYIETVTNRSDDRMNFYLYDRSDRSTLACPDGSVQGQVANDGNWNEWGAFSTCSASCGMNGIYQRTRTCPTEPQRRGYGCVGNALDIEACPDELCYFPAIPCHENYRKWLDKLKTKDYTCQLIPGAVDPRLEQ